MAGQDPELEGLFTDPADRAVVDLLRTARPAEPPQDPYFRTYLRAKLIAEARRTLPEPVRRSWFRWQLPVRPTLAFAAVAAGFLVVLVGIEVFKPGGPQAGPAIAVNSTAQGQKAEATADPIRLTFSGPVDQNAVIESLQIEPATAFTTRWEGQTLVVIPNHPLAANTSYTVTVKPKVAAASVVRPEAGQPTPAPQPPVVVRFVTAPAPLPPVVRPSYLTQDLTFLGDNVNRIAQPGRFGSATWTADGQLLVSRPAAAGPSASPSSSTSPSPSASPGASLSSGSAGQDLWLVSPDGTPLRTLATQAILPAAAPSGGRYAYWHIDSSGQASLHVGSIGGPAGDSPGLATIAGTPTSAPVWLGTGRLAYIDAGQVHFVDLSGSSPQAAPFPGSGPAAASPDGLLIAVQTPDGPQVLSLQGAGRPIRLPSGATGFAWSIRGDLAFLLTGAAGSQLFVLPHGAPAPQLIQAATSGETFSDISWSPDGTSLLFASRAGAGDTTHAFLVNATGTGLRPFGSPQSEYASPLWSPLGDRILFTRLDENQKPALWTAMLHSGALSVTDRAQQQAQAEVKVFMDARLAGDQVTALAQLAPAAQSAYQGSGLTLLASGSASFTRYYPVSVQLSGTNTFLVGVRTVVADPKSGPETGYFEEQLTVAAHGERYQIDAVKAGPSGTIGQGPTVLRFDVLPQPPGQQITVHFDSDLAQGTVSPTSVFLRDRDGNPVASTNFNLDENSVTFTVKLHPGTYTLVVTTAVQDINNKPLAQRYETPVVISS